MWIIWSLWWEAPLGIPLFGVKCHFFVFHHSNLYVAIVRNVHCLIEWFCTLHCALHYAWCEQVNLRFCPQSNFMFVHACSYRMSTDWITVDPRENSSFWFLGSSSTLTTGSLNTQLMTLTLCKSAPCRPLWTTTMTGESREGSGGRGRGGVRASKQWRGAKMEVISWEEEDGSGGVQLIHLMSAVASCPTVRTDWWL